MLGRVVEKAAHDIKDALNGVVLNVEVLRSRTDREGTEAPARRDLRALRPFAGAAAMQLEVLGERLEALLFLSRPHRERAGSPEVGTTLRHLGTLLAAAAKGDGGGLEVVGAQHSAPTSASADAVRLALASGMLALMEKGAGGRAQLSVAAELMVRFSHESAGACNLDAAVAEAIAGQGINLERSDDDLIMVFPGTNSHGT